MPPPDSHSSARPAEAGKPRAPSLTRTVLVALAIAIVIRATMGAPAHETTRLTPAPWDVAKAAR